jgi:hypothetical protein
MNTPTPTQIAEWRKAACNQYIDDDYISSFDIAEEHYIAGYIRARTEQSAEIAELKAKLAEVMPSNDPLVVWSVSSKAGFTLFKTLADAQRYVGQFPASIGGGLHISEIAVFGNIVKE